MKKKLFYFLLILIVLVVGLVAYIYFMALTDNKITIKSESNIKNSGGQVAEFMLKRAKILYEKKRLQSIITTYETYLTKTPDDYDVKKTLAKAYYDLGMLEFKQGNVPSGKKNIKKAVKLNPKLIEPSHQ